MKFSVSLRVSRWLPSLLLCLFLLTDVSAQRRGLWVDAERVEDLRVAVTVPESHHARAFGEMTSWIDANAINIIEVPNRLGSAWNIDRSFLASQAGLAALLSPDPADRPVYAQIAYDALRAIYDDPDSGGHQMLGSAQHLSKATVGMGFALAYEFAYAFWTPAQRDWVRGKMVAALDGWVNLSHPNFGGHFASNWLPVVRGAEVCLMLSVGDEADRPLRYRQLRAWLISNAHTHGPKGWGQEGNYYMAFGQAYALPAKLAMAATGDPEMAVALSPTQHHLVALYASAFTPSFDTLSWGVGGSIWDGGFAALAMATAPAGEKPYFRWWFDRFAGVLNPAPEALKYDRDNGGRIWSILYYPEAAPANPAEHFPLAIEDTGGFIMRSGWEGIDDIVLFLGTDRAFYAPGWDAPDALSLVVLGHGNRYINGPGNTAHQATAKDLFSTILVNNAVPETGRTGGREWFGLADNGAYAIASGGSQYANLGVSTAHRHLLADFSGESGTDALIGLRDKLRSSDGAHEYRWQINTGSGQVAIGSDSGRPTFTLSQPGNEGYLRGWVVHPANASLQTAGGRLFFNTTAVNADIWVVMAAGRGTPPAASISGNGLEATFGLNGVTMVWNGAEDRLQSSAVSFQPPPTAAFSVSPNAGGPPLTVTVNAGASASPASIVEYVWDFGDGSTATGVSTSHTYSEPGIHQVSLRVTDALGRHEVANRTVVVGSRWPAATFSVSPSSGQPPLTVTFNPGNTHHPGGLPLTYEWNLGDGTTFTRTNNAEFTHTFGNGTFRPTLVVRDANGAFDAAERVVTVANQAPVVVITADVGGGEAPLTVHFTGADSFDPDGDPITFLWEFGDGHSSTEINPVHTFHAPGDYTVRLTVTDDSGATGSRTLPQPIRVRTLETPLPALDPASVPGLLRGLEYSLYFNDISSGTGRMPFYFTPELITLLRTGVVNDFRTWMSNRSERYAFRYRGFIEIPADGVYTFYVRSRNGALLRIGGEELIRNNTRFSTVDAWNTLVLAAGLHEVDFIYYANESGSGPFYPFLDTSWSGPGFDRRKIETDRFFWRPGRPVADFVFSRAPGSGSAPAVYNFDAATSRAFEGEEISSYDWEFPGNVLKTGRAVSHAFGSGTHRVLLHVTTTAGITTSTAKSLTVPVAQDFELAGATDRALMPGKIIRARGEFLPNGLATGAFDGDKTTRWLDLSLQSWIEIEFRNQGQLNPYVISEYRITSLTVWNERDPYSWKLYGSNNGTDWTLLHEITGNSFSGSHPRTNTFPIDNTTAYAFYRFDDIQATGTSTAPDGTGVNLIELIDYGTGNQPTAAVPVPGLDIPNTTPAVGQAFVLDGSASAAPDGYPLYYLWDFGDGQTQQGWELSQVHHTYHTPGDYTVSLTVRGALGISATAAMPVSAAVEPNADPVATYTYLKTAPTGRTEVTFDASGSYDPDADPIHFHWEFGDGSTAEGPVVTHSFAVGTYTPLLTVTDDRGGRGTHAQELAITLPTERPLSIGLNFSGRPNEVEDTLYPNEFAGLVPQANWNNVTGAGSGFSDSEGEGVFLTLGSTGSGLAGYGSPTTPFSPDHRLMRTARGAVNGTMDFINVPYALYDVYVYHGARRETNDRDVTWWMEISSDSQTQRKWIRQSAFTWNGSFEVSEALTAAEAVDGQSVVVFRGLTDRNFKLRSGSHQGRTLAHAIQIVDASGGTIVPPLNPPFTPVALTGEGISSSVIVLQWEVPFGVIDGYRIERAPPGAETWIQVGETTETAFTDTGLAHSTAYRYRVFAFNSGGSSEAAGPLTLSTLPPASDPPTTPDGFTALATSATSVFIQWNAPPGPVDGYRLERSTGQNGPWSLVTQSALLSHNDTGLLPGTVYRYRIRAENEAGASAWSMEVSAQTGGEFGDGEEVPVVVWGPGAYFNNPDGSGTFTDLPGLVQGTVEINGSLTGYRARPWGSAALQPNYQQESPLSERFHFAGIIFHGLGTASNPSVFLRLDGRINSGTVTEIVFNTTTSQSAHAANLIWWSKEDFLNGFEEAALTAENTFASVEVNAPYHLLVRQNGQFYISQLITGSGAVQLSAQTWVPIDPETGGPLGLFAHSVDGEVFSANGRAFAPVVLDNIEAIGLYAERVDDSANRRLALREFRVVTVLPEEGGSPPAYADWLIRAGFSAAEREDPAIAGPLADPEGTGLSNLLRFAIGAGRGFPGSAALPQWLEVEADGTLYPAFRYRRLIDAPGLTYIPETSTTLAPGDWTPLGSAWIEHGPPLSTGDGFTEDVSYRLTQPLPPGVPTFLRVRIEETE